MKPPDKLRVWAFWSTGPHEAGSLSANRHPVGWACNPVDPEAGRDLRQVSGPADCGVRRISALLPAVRSSAEAIIRGFNCERFGSFLA